MPPINGRLALQFNESVVTQQAGNLPADTDQSFPDKKFSNSENLIDETKPKWSLLRWLPFVKVCFVFLAIGKQLLIKFRFKSLAKIVNLTKTVRISIEKLQKFDCL